MATRRGKHETVGLRTKAKAPFTVFLDRDGVLNVDRWPGVFSRRRFRWIPGSREAIVRLRKAGCQIVLVTNQPWAHSGIFTPGRLHRLHAWLQADLATAGGGLARVEAATWPWGRRRKPRPGMLEDAAKELARAGTPVDKARAVMVGDKKRDMEAARRFGIPGIRVGRGGDVPDLAKAAERIVADL